MKKIPLYLGLGSNLGDRRANLNEALRQLDEALGALNVAAGGSDVASGAQEVAAGGSDEDSGALNVAVGGSDEVSGCVRDKVSEFIVTEPQGFSSDELFLNGVVRYVVNVPRGTNMAELAHRILEVCKGVEHQMGRTEVPEYDSDGRRIYHSRIIDIDILLLGDFRLDDPDLQIPHPRMYERDFVMRPLKSL